MPALLTSTSTCPTRAYAASTSASTSSQRLRADARVPAGERRVLAVAERAVELDRRVDDLVHHVRQEDLRDGVLLTQVHALFRFVCNVQEHQPRHVQLARAVGEHPLHA